MAIYVGANKGFQTIQSAINYAAALTPIQQIIYISPGNYTENLTFTSGEIQLVADALQNLTAENPSVIVTGNHTVSGTSNPLIAINFGNIQFVKGAAAAGLFTVTASGPTIDFFSCIFENSSAVNTDVFTLSPAAGGAISFTNCSFNSVNPPLASTKAFFNIVRSCDVSIDGNLDGVSNGINFSSNDGSPFFNTSSGNQISVRLNNVFLNGGGTDVVFANLADSGVNFQTQYCYGDVSGTTGIMWNFVGSGIVNESYDSLNIGSGKLAKNGGAGGVFNYAFCSFNGVDTIDSGITVQSSQYNTPTSGSTGVAQQGATGLAGAQGATGVGTAGAKGATGASAGGGSSVIPSGAVFQYAGTAIPTGYLLCDGSPASKSTYANLFAAIGSAYGLGANDGLTFSLPDMRGYFARGLDNGSGHDPNASSRTAQNGGNSGNAIGSFQSDGVGSHAHSVNGCGVGAGSSGGASNFTITDFNGQSFSPSTNSNSGNETRPKNVYFNFIIKF